MKKLVPLTLAVLTTGCMAEPPPERYSARTEAGLARELAGRTAGPPRNCIPSRDLLGNRSVGEGAVIFSTRSRKLIYVNRPPAGCPEIRPGMALRTRTTGTQLCRGDIVEVFDPVMGFGRGACSLGDFQPYRRAR